MADYTAMPLAQQISMLDQENKNQNLREAKSQMWKHAVLDLNDAEANLGQQTDKLETAWTDIAGDNFVAKARDTQSVIRQWTQNISSANPGEKLDQINTLVPQALSLAKANQALFQQYMATQGGVAVNLGYSADQLEAPYREPSGKLMDQIAALYEEGGRAVTDAGSGPKYRGIDDTPGGGGDPSPSVSGGGGGGAPSGAVGASPGGGAPTGEVTDPLAGADPQTGVDGTTGTEGAPDPLLSDPLGAGGGDLPTGADAQDAGGQDPSLAGGLGSAPTPSVSSPIGAGGGTGAGVLPTGGGASPIPSLNGGLGGTGGTGSRLGGGTGGGGGGGGGTGLGAMPTPITSIPGLGTGSGNSSGNSGGNGQGGGLGGGGGPVAGVKVPGVSLGGGAGIPGLGSAGGGGIGGGGLGAVGGVGGGTGGGTGQIPAAATPYQAPAATAPGGVVPTAPTSAGAATAGGAGSGGGMGGMPMSPMGMGGAGGGGGTPGSGAVSRPAGNNRRRKEVVTPGLPVMLSGKAGMADMNAFAGRGRKQVQESDVPTTVQLIDEDLWQVEQKPAAEEQVVAPPVRRAH